MQTKVCSKCKKEKSVDLFRKRTRTLDGYNYKCKECSSTANPDRKAEKEKRKELLDKGRKVCSMCNKEKDLSEFTISNGRWYKCYCRECSNDKIHEYRLNNPEKIKEYKEKTKDIRREKDARYREDNRDKLRVVSTEYNKKCRDYRIQKRRERLLDPTEREKEREEHRKWRQDHREEYNQYFKDHYEKYPIKKIIRNIRHGIPRILRGKSKASKTMELIGCSKEFLMQHLESQFTEGMNWSNYGIRGWWVDHIIPCAAFDHNDPEQQKACHHWSNLQPMWYQENISKNSNYDGVRYYYDKKVS